MPYDKNDAMGTQPQATGQHRELDPPERVHVYCTSCRRRAQAYQTPYTASAARRSGSISANLRPKNNA